MPRKWEGKSDWEIFTKNMSHRGRVSKTYKLEHKIRPRTYLKLSKSLEQMLYKRRYQNIHKQMKKCSTPLVIREIKSKTHNEIPALAPRMVTMANNTKCWSCGATRTFSHSWWEFGRIQAFGKHFGSFL